MSRSAFITWIREVINPQAGPGNNVCLSDYNKDGTKEYLYPKRFMVKGDKYFWIVRSMHTKKRHLCTHYELLFSGAAFTSANRKVATGPLDKTKMRRGLRIIYEYYHQSESEAI